MPRLPETTFARGSEGDSWEELEAARFSGTLPFTRLSLNSSGHSGRSCDEFPRPSSLILSLLVDAGCSVEVTASCDEDVGQDELEKLVGRPGTTTGK